MSGSHGVDGYEDPRLSAFGLVMDVWFLLSAQLTPVLARHDIAEHDFDALLQLARSPQGELRMSDLATETGMSTSGMTRVVDRLERKELATRRPHPTDRRASVVALTAEGVARLRTLMPDLLAAIDQWFTSRLPNQQLDEMLNALSVIREALKVHSQDGSAPAGQGDGAASANREAG